MEPNKMNSKCLINIVLDEINKKEINKDRIISCLNEIKENINYTNKLINNLLRD